MLWALASDRTLTYISGEDMGMEVSSMLLGITEKESPACSNRYRLLGEREASINNESSFELFMGG
jgi:hypothetical protein